MFQIIVRIFPFTYFNNRRERVIIIAVISIARYLTDKAGHTELYEINKK